MTEIAGRLGHLPGRAAAVRPVRVRVAVTAQGRAQAGPLRPGGRLVEQPGQVVRLLAACCLGDDLGGDRAYPGQGRQRSLAYPAIQISGGEILDHLRRPAERPHPVGRRARPFQLERDLPQCLYWSHLSSPTRASTGYQAG